MTRLTVEIEEGVAIAGDRSHSNGERAVVLCRMIVLLLSPWDARLSSISHVEIEGSIDLKALDPKLQSRDKDLFSLY